MKKVGCQSTQTPRLVSYFMIWYVSTVPCISTVVHPLGEWLTLIYKGGVMQHLVNYFLGIYLQFLQISFCHYFLKNYLNKYFFLMNMYHFGQVIAQFRVVCRCGSRFGACGICLGMTYEWLSFSFRWVYF